MEVHQILPALSYGDAVSNDAIEIQTLLSEHGYTSRIFAKYAHPKVSKFASQLSSYKGSPQNIVMYHFSLAGGDVTEYVKQLPDKKVLIYHNITPPEFFDGYDDGLRCSCEHGLEELKGLKNHFLLAIGDSEYNRQCLEQFGYSNTGVIPILIDTDSWSKDIDPDDLDRTYENCTINILFVGRVAPNKKHEDIIKIFYYYHRCINPNSKLYLVGSKQIPRYLSSLEELITELRLSDAVIFTGIVSETELIRYYQMAHVFLCMSEHEGFCVPLLEAMYFNIPVIYFKSTATSYTMGDSGITVTAKNYSLIAELVNLIVEDPKLRDKITLKQRIHLQAFSKENTAKRLIQLIEGLRIDMDSVLPTFCLKSELPKVSVIVCTYNRADHLKKCLDSLRNQEYSKYEVIVVNGPSTDATEEILSEYPEFSVVRQCKLNGLSSARNLGILSSSGDIVAFLDDDAVADPDWIQSIIRGYVDETVGGIGGPVFDITGQWYQFKNGYISKAGIPTFICETDLDYNDPRGDYLNYIMGTNSSFRKSILEKVGFFDVGIRYYLDETDVCVRVIQAGYKIRHLDTAIVYHAMAEGHNRKSSYEINYSEILKNVIYFTLKNFGGDFSSYSLRPMKALHFWVHIATDHFRCGNVNFRQFLNILREVMSGAICGYKKGLLYNFNKVKG